MGVLATMTLFTLSLWRGIYLFPAHHPLFYRTLQPYERFWYRRPPTFMYVMLFVVGLWVMGELANTLELPLLIGAVGVAFAGGSLNGLHIVYNVSRYIAHQRENGQYDLIATTPVGQFVSGWAQAARHIRRHHGYNGINQLAGLGQLLGMLLIFPLGLVVIPASSSGSVSVTAVSAATSAGLLMIFNGIILTLMLRYEYMRSIGTATLLSVIIPARVGNKGNAGMAAVWIFLCLQFVVYIALIGGVFVLFGGLLRLFSVNAILSSLFHLLLIVLIGEWVNRFLWRRLQTELNTDRVEFEGLLMYTA
jgi:hypothetical protein